MAGVNVIKDASASVQKTMSALAQRNRYYDRSVSSVSARWKGKAGEAFKDSCTRTKRHADSIVNEYGDLYTKTLRLADSVRKAESDERNR
jgi:uncharacterized protein YukE